MISHTTIDAPIEKLYWKIGEVSKMFLVAPSTIRFWEREFGIVTMKGRRTGKDFHERKFTAKNIQELEKIRHLLKDRAFTLRGAKMELLKPTN